MSELPQRGNVGTDALGTDRMTQKVHLCLPEHTFRGVKRWKSVLRC